MKISHRRDSFCGKMSVCNNMMQYGIPYSLTAQHTVPARLGGILQGSGLVFLSVPGSAGPYNLRVGAIGARPAAFNTVRYSEKLLETSGISVDTSIFPKSLGASKGSRITTMRYRAT